MLEMEYLPERIEPLILHKGEINGYKFKIISLGTHPVAYVCIPKDHPARGKHYDKIQIECHGGLTFSNSGKNYVADSKNEWWIGWDYHHYNDYSGIYSNFESWPLHYLQSIKYSTEIILAEVEDVIEQLEVLYNV